jgi:uncharacterized membrane protein
MSSCHGASAFLFPPPGRRELRRLHRSPKAGKIATKGEMLRALFRSARRDFVRGLWVTLPILATIYILWLIYRFFLRLTDATLGAFLTGLWGKHWWVSLAEFSLTIVATVALIWLLGFMTRHYAGRALHRYLERLLQRLPLINQAYGITKQVTNALFRADVPAFKKVVLVQYPRKGVYTLGFITQEETGKLGEALGDELVTVYAPTSPNPFSGWVLFIPKEEVIYTKVSVEEGLRLVISGGVIVPGLELEEEEGPPVGRPSWLERLFRLRRGRKEVARFEPAPQGDYNDQTGG